MIEATLKEKAKELGFELAGIARATEADGFERFREWLARGYAGKMEYLHRSREARRHPNFIVEGVRSVVMLGMAYSQRPLQPPPADRMGRVAAYAQGPDYHRYLWDRLNRLAAWLEAEAPGCLAHGIADTAPLLERDFARRAGLGWFGKNTMLIHKHRGSFFFLAGLLTTLELQPDKPFEASHCGSCTACLDACPTHAFPEPGWLDARRCISYLTIELRGPVDEELRPALDEWLFGCDICLQVCPWNRKAVRLPVSFPHRPDLEGLDALELLGLSEKEFKTRFQGTSLLRTRRSGLLRNAALFLGNTAGPEALPALQQATLDDDPIIQNAAQWAIEQISARSGYPSP